MNQQNSNFCHYLLFLQAFNQLFNEFMNLLRKSSLRTYSAILVSLFTINAGVVTAQNIRFGIFADPVIGWFSSDTRETKNEGARAGFNFGFTFNKYFANNYSFSTGLNILTAGGRLVSSDTITMEFTNFDTEVAAGKPVVYKIQYLNIPVGLKFETNQIGYVTFFADIGLDPKIAIGGKVDIPSANIKGERAMDEIRHFNMGYHILGGIDYSLGGTTAIVLGLGFEHNFLDVTKENNIQPRDRISHNLLKFRVGINF